MPELMSVVSTSPQDWRYIAEGGATIVFAYVGPAHPAFDGTVLRLRKSFHNATSAEIVEDVQNSHFEEPDDPSIVFQRAIIARLVTPAHLPRLEPVLVNRPWLECLEILWNGQRPAQRRALDRIDVTRRKAVLAENLVKGDGWAVEIKPKWGFLPTPAYLSDATKTIKTRVCRFCMQSHHAVSEKQVVASGYCPLDLYSGESTRISRALGALWDTWILSSGGVNNLRIFVEGEPLRPISENPDSIRPLAERLSYGSTSAIPDLTNLRQKFISSLLLVLLDSPILGILSTLQRTLDSLDIEGLSALWTQVHTSIDSDTPRRFGEGAAEPTFEEWSQFIDMYLARTPEADTGPTVQSNTAQLRYHLLAYLLSATFKDCSVIVRMLPPGPAEQTGDGREWNASAYLIDLDVKSISRLAKWERLDRWIVERYAQTGDTRICVDARAAT
ncbi:hypothetical protein OBBRIDRAFT_890169 [Obba rivulosa]|uniref:Inositol-pentakisphosphate 2-kinase n=1 Tax=Obba rivulosa TaxID=1052685 RepID=A0A8E2DGB3_9APHY|nr:hypothetical protein OBBRIDRAFT_890169 [Obba rivulosa]